jgi:hypothetical protein
LPNHFWNYYLPEPDIYRSALKLINIKPEDLARWQLLAALLIRFVSMKMVGVAIAPTRQSPIFL